VTGSLLVLLSVAALSASTALLAAALGRPLVADLLAAAAVLAGLAAFIATAVFTIRRAGRAGGS
jgi:hypothetical protein